MKDLKKWTMEALKEGLRVFTSGVSLITGYIVTQVNLTTGAINVDWALVIILIKALSLVSGVKAIDKLIHEYKKAVGIEGNYKGLFGF